MIRRGPLLSAVHLLMTVAILFLGSALTLTGLIEPLRIVLMQKILNHPSTILLLGLLLLSFGGALLLILSRIHGYRYYQLKLHCHQAEVDRAIIQRYVNDYWHHTFPNASSLPEVAISGKNRFEIIAQLPPAQVEEEEMLFKRLENELGVLLARHLGYEDDFYLTVVQREKAPLLIPCESAL